MYINFVYNLKIYIQNWSLCTYFCSLCIQNRYKIRPKNYSVIENIDTKWLDKMDTKWTYKIAQFCIQNAYISIWICTKCTYIATPFASIDTKWLQFTYNEVYLCTYFVHTILSLCTYFVHTMWLFCNCFCKKNQVFPPRPLLIAGSRLRHSNLTHNPL